MTEPWTVDCNKWTNRHIAKKARHSVCLSVFKPMVKTYCSMIGYKDKTSEAEIFKRLAFLCASTRFGREKFTQKMFNPITWNRYMDSYCSWDFVVIKTNKDYIPWNPGLFNLSGFKSSSPPSWWFQPIWKICSSNSIISPSRGEHKKRYLKTHHLAYIQQIIRVNMVVYITMSPQPIPVIANR